jgi:hypothetical protein
MHPSITHLQALFTTTGLRFDGFNLIQMRASRHSFIVAPIDSKQCLTQCEQNRAARDHDAAGQLKCRESFAQESGSK